MKLSALQRMAARYGFVLWRIGKHAIWRNAVGRTVVTSTSPSDHRADANMEHEFRRAQRRSRQPRPDPRPSTISTPLP